MTRATVYDFTEAQQQLNKWFTPKQLMDELRECALELTVIDAGAEDHIVRNMQLAVLSVCDFLRTIKEKPCTTR